MEAVLFDLDGTICDTVPLCVESFKKALNPLVGYGLSEKEILKTFGVSEEGTVMAICPEKYEQGIKAYYEAYKGMHDMCPNTFEGIVDVLTYLDSKGIFVGLITGKGRVSCDISLDYYGIKDYFKVIKTGSQNGSIKHLHMRDIIAGYNFDADNVIYIGDTVSDIESCRKAGIKIISVAYSVVADETELMRSKPDKLCSSVHELKRYLEEIV